MTLALLVLMTIIAGYLYYTTMVVNKPNVVVVSTPAATYQQRVPATEFTQTLASIATRRDPFNDPYAPPLKSDELYFPPLGGDIRGSIPVNIQTRSTGMDYQQLGIITRMDSMILPLMGRKLMSGRDKWQYYTISNTGSVNTKLPIRVRGKRCTNEYGCDEIMEGDDVFVEGYNDTFRATIYETNLFQYLPQL
jgi:hypothetical protein